MFHSPQMVKKRVPEWLNSSLWSSSTPSPSIDDDLVQRYTSNPTAAAAATTTPISSYSVSDSDPPSTVDPPIPVAPPKSTREDKHLPEPQFSDSFPDHEDKSNNTAPSPEDISRQSQLLAELSRKVINLRELRRISSQGIPDGAGIRSTVWKLLLGYLPPDRGLWLSELAKKRSQYKHFKVELLMNPSEIARKMDNCTTCDNDELKCQSKGLLSRSEIPRGEHPLSLGKSSVWNQFFQASAEADTFFCFVELLSGFRDHFCQQLDNSVVGIRSTITRLSQLLKEHDEELWRHLEITTKVNPQFYAFRWITLLLTQEFNFADSLHIWDTLLSDPEGPQETLLRVCCAMLILIRRRLLAGDFTSNLKLLQNYPPTNISHLLYVANKLRVQSSG
ncbi:TBC1 domain family member 13-like isoform X3 [Pyrus x bretschneideri]|uniref:TBC1 domain family member 13-like isoform X3 n=1 Tax=Pyrus x bretschneideri TaxID=225117 RepID=UPI00202E226B|nr:TBC1 domain family member 13-like isoform X3 [Pyrus x bretschneideri]